MVRYRSPEPVLSPETPDECSGVVNDVVFPTGIDPCDDRPRTYDVYYGMADERVGRVRLALRVTRVLRFYLIATAIVLVAGVAIAALYRGGSGRDLRVASVQTTASPSPPRRQDTTSHGPIRADRRRAVGLSALPECFARRREVHGPPAYVHAALPARRGRSPRVPS